MRENILHLTCSEYNLESAGKTYFVTFSDAQDVFSTWVRDKYHIINNLDLAIRLLKDTPGSLLDLGANIGTFAIPLIKSVRCKSTLVEALQPNCLLLKTALGINDIHNAAVINAATLDRDGMVHMAGESAYGRVSTDKSLPATPCKTVDTLCHEYELKNIALLKIDVEGSELKTLHGATQFFKQNPNVNVIIESNGGHCYANNYRPADIIRFLEHLGYDIYAIYKQTLVRQTSEDFQPFGIIDYLATRLPVKTLPFPQAKLSRDQVIQNVLDALTNKNPAYRDYMRAELNNAPVDIQNDIVVKDVLSQLPDD